MSNKERLKHQWKHMVGGRKRNDAKNPRRELLLVVEALRRLGFRYWTNVQIDNPYKTNRKGEASPGIQWIHFIVAGRNRKLFAIEMYPRWPGNATPHLYQKRWMEEKKAFLQEKGIPCLILPRTVSTVQEYWVRIEIFLRGLRQ